MKKLVQYTYQKMMKLEFFSRIQFKKRYWKGSFKINYQKKPSAHYLANISPQNKTSMKFFKNQNLN